MKTFRRLALLSACALALGCPSSSSNPDGDADDAVDVPADDAVETTDGGDEPGDTVEDVETETEADAGETRTLEPTVLLGEGGFFGTSGGVLGNVLGTGGPDAYGIGAHYADISGGVGEPIQAGRLYIFQNGPLPATVADAALVLEPPDGELAAGGGFAYAFAGPCDFDADTHPDLAVSDHLWGDAVAPNAGRVFVFWGEDGGLSTTRVTTHQLSAGLRARSDVLGQTVTCADFDGDGFDDLLATGQNAGPDDTGLAAFFSGSATGLPATESSTLVAPVRANRQYFGSSVLWADLDGDGARDLAIGGWGLIGGGRLTDPHTGAVAVYAGGTDWASGPSAVLAPATTEEVQAGSSMALVDTGTRLFVAVGAPAWGLPGAVTGALLVWEAGHAGFADAALVDVLLPPAGIVDLGFGNSVGWIPDFHGEGRGALLAGIKYADCDGNPGTGAVAVFAPEPDGSSFADAPELLCAPAPASNDAFGSSIAPLDDLDGDGLRDFLVGMEGHVEGDPFTGVQTGGVVFFR
jgi:hypothetical protein